MQNNIIIPPENLDIINSYTYSSIIFIEVSVLFPNTNSLGEIIEDEDGTIEYNKSYYTIIFIKDFVGDDYRILQILENVEIVESSKDAKLLVTLYPSGEIRLFRRYINTRRRGRENIQYIQDEDTHEILRLPNTQFICISKDKTFFLTGEDAIVRKFIINAETREYNLNNNISPFTTSDNKLVSLQITNNNIIASYYIVNGHFVDNYIFIYDFNFILIYRIEQLLNQYELISTQSSNDAQIISALYRTYIYGRSLINIWIRNNDDTFFPVQMYLTPDNIDNICISSNGRFLVSIIHSSLCIWHITEDIINNFRHLHNNGETEINANEDYLQVIPLDEYEYSISTFHITDDMQIIIIVNDDIIIFEKNEDNIYSHTQTLPNFNNRRNYYSNNIKSVIFNRNILNYISDYGNKKSKSPRSRRRSKKLKSSRRRSKKLKSSRRRSKKSKYNKRKKSVKRS
jgi:hypothetical protein